MYSVLYNEPLSSRCSMRVGGNADAAIFPQTAEELISAVNDCKIKKEKYIIIGNASNVIFADDGYRGTVIFTTELKKICVEDNKICAQAGATLTALSRFALEHGICGYEFAYGIPGTVGGGVYMNAGAYGGEISDVFLQCECIDKSGNVIKLYKGDMDFSYRKSIIHTEKYILLNAYFACRNGEYGAIKEKMDSNMTSRKTKQPLEFPSCGSFFKRPSGNYAGTLIEKCGLKGFTVGGAAVSDKHAGFVINKSGATAADIMNLKNAVIKRVYEETGVTLEPEVEFVG